ncbi:deoxynucleoside triphosphate triphosphohydrolase SAMHD1-like isoform X1 [Clavelina lepadiformis]|uniref:deoxynucleoside triphosphate triphosphohydrolase SAMHD1-like isoform X1 n=1 Tax=Clavelina lepadiformis TaxID=159417 RepID=UPI004042EF56
MMSEENAAISRSSSGGSGRTVLPKKCFQDPVHGPIELHLLLVKIIDTPQFQRLRNIKQLGTTYLIYPGASHNRFEHCIGTSHLAGELARTLQDKHPDLVDDNDVLCVEIAGLCHDLGHGPYSHVFDDKFLPQVCPDTNWKHEKGSCAMLDHLMEQNNLKDALEAAGLTMPRDFQFIKEMIAGPLNPENQLSFKDWPYEGRTKAKGFLYEIVSNDVNKVDVDKWDYFARDYYHLGIKNSFDHKRFMHFLKVLQVGEDTHICQRDKEYWNLLEMFHVRSSLHRRACKHRVRSTIDAMICDALVLADQHIKISGKDGIMRSISKSIDDMVAYEKLTDNIFYQILYSTDQHADMNKAREILNRILCRNLYKHVGTKKLPSSKERSKNSSMHSKIPGEIAELDVDKELRKEDIVVNDFYIDYCMGAKNPCDHYWFYSKDEPNTPRRINKDEISDMFPKTFQDWGIQVFCKEPTKFKKVKQCFQKWCQSEGNANQESGSDLDEA